MHLEIKQANDRTEQVSSTCIDKLYNLSKNGLLDATIDLRGSINAAVAYEDAVTFLNTMWGPDLIVTASNYYIRFADPEVERVLIAKGVMQEGEGLTMAQADDLPTGSGDANQSWWNSNTTIKEFDEIKYFGRLKNGAYQMGQWFTNATNLESVDLTGFTRLEGHLLFEGCKNLEYFHGRNNTPNTLNLEDLTQLSARFKGCLKLYHIASLGSITSINDHTFESCTNLETVNLPLSCINLGSSVFKSDSKLHTINLSHVTRIGTAAFDGCSSLEYCDGPNSTQGELNLPNLTGTLGNSVFKGCTKLTSVASLGSITSIESSAFENCTNLATINFPSTVTSIGAVAFNNTAWYNNQPNGPVYIVKVLYKCKNVSGALVIPNNIVSISGGAFYDCSSLTSVTIGSGVDSIGIGDGVFNGCQALSTIVVDSNNATYDSRDNSNTIIQTASNRLIACCKNSTFPSSLNSLNPTCFKQSPKILDFTDQNSGLSNINITTVEGNLFRGCNFEEVYFPDTVTTVKYSAFQGCKSLKKVDFGSGVTSLEGNVFHSTYDSSGTASIIVVIRATTPPSIVATGQHTFNFSAVHSIQVPASAVQTYKDVWGNAGLSQYYLNMIAAIPTT